MPVGKRRVEQQLPPEVRQFTGTLPYFREEVPVLCLRDGTPSIPIRVLCRLLGLHPETYLLAADALSWQTDGVVPALWGFPPLVYDVSMEAGHP